MTAGGEVSIGEAVVGASRPEAWGGACGSTWVPDGKGGAGVVWWRTNMSSRTAAPIAWCGLCTLRIWVRGRARYALDMNAEP